jgi:D-arabinose 5-phosphate isomerase GutQ
MCIVMKCKNINIKIIRITYKTFSKLCIKEFKNLEISERIETDPNNFYLIYSLWEEAKKVSS